MTASRQDDCPATAAGEPVEPASPGPAAWVLVALCSVFYFGLCGVFFSFTADDAFIIARYAENLVRGEGLVFNVGERINALTCPLMALVQAGIYALTGATLVGTKLLSIALVAAAHLACLWRLRERSDLVCLYSVLAVASPFLAFWAIGGMETPLLLALVTAATLLYLRIEDRGIDRWSAAAVSVVWALCFLTRYDSVLFCAPPALALLVRHARKAGWLVAPALVIAGGWLVFAQAYYHDVLPTSFYVKSPIWRSYEVKRTVAYLLQFAICSGWGLLAVAILARLLAGGAASRQAVLRHVKQYPGLYLGLACFACYAAMNATKHMMFSYRMIVPLVPAAGVVILELFALARVRNGRRSARGGLLAAACLGMLAVQGFFAWQIDRVSINPGYVGEYLRWGRRSYVEGFSQALRDSAAAIRQHWLEQPDHGTPKMSTFAAGITPYYLPEAYVYEQLVSHRRGGTLDWDRVFGAVDYAVAHTPHGATLEEIAAIHPRTEWTLVARYPFWFDGRWADLCVLYNPSPQPYPLPRFVDGSAE